MSTLPVPLISVAPMLRRTIAAAGAGVTVEEAEASALRRDFASALAREPEWQALRTDVAESLSRRGHAVVRGVDADGGRSLLLIAALLGGDFESYRPRRIVKRFRMSPWTTELSHTVKACEFHTDGNIAAVPPAATAIQCETEDPGGPEYGQQRVAHLPDLLSELGPGPVLDFLTRRTVAMAHDKASSTWRGRLVEDGKIRYHPAGLRTANARSQTPDDGLEANIAAIHRAAMAVSAPISGRAGDVLLVSNHSALHYRGACSVRFNAFPMDYEARSVLVLHQSAPQA